MRFARSFRVGAAMATTVAVLAGCAPGWAADPKYATDRGSGPQGSPVTRKPDAGPPPVEKPKNDLAWRDCTSRVFSEASVPPPVNVKLDCATFDAELDPISTASGTITVGVVRARSSQTPPDAGPLVVTTGWNMPTSVQLPVWLTRAGADVLKTRPIVAVDRRGIGMSDELDCRDSYD